MHKSKYDDAPKVAQSNGNKIGYPAWCIEELLKFWRMTAIVKPQLSFLL